MKAGRSIQGLAAELQRQADSKKDYVADTRRLSFKVLPGGSGEGHHLILDGVNGGMPLRPTAHGQMAGALGIPWAYYERMLKEKPDLLAANVNVWMGSEAARSIRWAEDRPNVDPAGSGSKKLIRTLDGQVRAVLSDRYRPLDNLDLAEAVLPKLVEVGAQVVSCDVTESRLYLKAVTERISGEVKVGDRVQAGVVVSNSEIGHGSLRVEVLDYWLICLNGMVRESAMRKAHLGRGARGQDVLEESREYYREETQAADDKAFFMKVTDVTAAMFDPERFAKRLDQYRSAGERKITAPVEQVVEVTAKRLQLTDGERSSVLQHLIRGGDLTSYGLANAVTRAAQDVESYDRSTDMEAMGGQIIEMPKRDWESMALAV